MHNSGVFSPNSTGPLGLSQAKSPDFYSQGSSYANVVVKELDNVAGEILAIREAIREESKREDAMINLKVSKFDEFRLHVID